MNTNSTLSTTELHELFSQRFGDDSNAFTVRAPGRVNLIGEHVDYNDGYVLPMAIPLETGMRVRPRADRTVELYATNFDQTLSFSLDNIEHQKTWIDYVQGVASELAKGVVPLHGFEGIVTSSVPMASGLSSSAAIEVASALVFTHLAQQPMSAPDLALLCQKAENKFVGVNSGIMDQMAVAACHADHALLIDCRSLELQQIPFKLQHHSIVITDSGAPRELAASAYNERRAQCEDGLAFLQEKLPHVNSLRDVSREDFLQYADKLPLVVCMRVRHVVEEIERTERAVEALQAGDLATFGRHMNDSHESLAKLYEVTSPELDWLASWAQAHPGVLGSRMTGAGFGGCTVTLIENEHAEEFMRKLPGEYQAAMNREARCWIGIPVNGAEVLT